MSDRTEHEIDSGVVKDQVDDRDRLYLATSSAPLPTTTELADYRTLADETWHQRGEECTGFALAAIANYLIRRIDGQADQPSVSRRMLYEMAQRYDGEMHVEGSTLRGALTGWSRVGVSSDDAWPYHPNDEHGTVHGSLTLARILDGRSRPLTGYQRIADERVETMKRALVEGNPLYVAARTHVGWYRLFLSTSSSVITRRPDDVDRGIHAFVIIGFDETGFVMQNSWGPEWGDDGYAVLPFDQWTAGATDAWVIDGGIAAPVEPVSHDSLVTALGAASDDTAAKALYRDMWPHLVVLQDDGQLASTGLYEMDEGSVKTLLYLFDEHTKAQNWQNRRLAVVAGGAGQTTTSSIEGFRSLRDTMLANEIYPIFFVWETAWHDDLAHELLTWAQHRDDANISAGVATKIAAADSLCQAIWHEFTDRAHRACTTRQGGAHLLAQSIAYKRNQRPFDLHLISHGIGDLLMAPLATILPAPVTSATAVASALPLHRFERIYGEMLLDGCLQHLTVGNLTPDAEAADRFGPTDASLLELASQVWELSRSAMRETAHVARRTGNWDVGAVPLLGLSSDFDRSELAGHLQDAGRVESMQIAGVAHMDLLTTTAVSDRIVSRLLADRHAARLSPALPTDPIRRAKLLGASTNAV